jgi:hypothetical protein
MKAAPLARSSAARSQIADLWLLRHWKAGRIFGAVFLALTILATLGLGEHYIFDLFCAVPYAAIVLWIAGLSYKSVVLPSRSDGDLEAA